MCGYVHVKRRTIHPFTSQTSHITSHLIMSKPSPVSSSKRRKIANANATTTTPTTTSDMLDQDAVRRHMLSLMQHSVERDQGGQGGSSGSTSGDESESGSDEDENEDEDDDDDEEVKQEADSEDEDVDVADNGLNSEDEVDIKPPPSTSTKSQPISTPTSTKPLKTEPTLSRINPSSLKPTPTSTPTVPLKTTFPSLGLSPALISTLRSISILKPTEIQSACIEPILKGRDCVGGAKTGSGKTMAFALPILQRIMRDPFGIWAVVLTPTR
jgi:ATP-dependent RNA helicase DDX49/DBP8